MPEDGARTAGHIFPGDEFDVAHNGCVWVAGFCCGRVVGAETAPIWGNRPHAAGGHGGGYLVVLHYGEDGLGYADVEAVGTFGEGFADLGDGEDPESEGVAVVYPLETEEFGGLMGGEDGVKCVQSGGDGTRGVGSQGGWRARELLGPGGGDGEVVETLGVFEEHLLDET